MSSTSLENRNPLFSSQKISERRTLIINVSDNPSEEEQNVISELLPKLSQLSREIIQTAEKIIHNGIDIVKVHVDVQKQIGLNQLTEVIFSTQNSERIRVVVGIKDYIENESNVKMLLYENSISHVVEIGFLINLTDKDSKIFPANYCKASTLLPHEISNIVVDFALDIGMFHYFYPDSLSNDLNFRSEIPGKKAEFLERNKYSVQWSKNLKFSDNYYSFATASRTSNGSLDIGKYIKIWEDFFSENSQGLPPRNSLGDNSQKILERNEDLPLRFRPNVNIESNSIRLEKEAIIIRQLIRHKELGQLNVRRILKISFGLPSGKYMLIRLKEKPSERIVRRTLYVYFGGKSWHLGKIKILPKNQFQDISRFSQYISIFYFKIP